MIPSNRHQLGWKDGESLKNLLPLVSVVEQAAPYIKKKNYDLTTQTHTEWNTSSLIF